MHTGHLILVQAESHDDAIATVRAALHYSDGENFAGSWSDWSVVGDDGLVPSRWNFHTEFEDWDGASSYAVSLADEADLFHKALNHFYAFRENEFARLANQIAENTLSLYTLDQNDMESYALVKFAYLAESHYFSHSFVYDLQNYSADLKHFRESEKIGETDWYGVLVDFHF